MSEYKEIEKALNKIKDIFEDVEDKVHNNGMMYVEGFENLEKQILFTKKLFEKYKKSKKTDEVRHE